jgi:hypothetical protein
LEPFSGRIFARRRYRSVSSSPEFLKWRRTEIEETPLNAGSITALKVDHILEG